MYITIKKVLNNKKNDSSTYHSYCHRYIIKFEKERGKLRKSVVAGNNLFCWRVFTSTNWLKHRQSVATGNNLFIWRYLAIVIDNIFILSATQHSFCNHAARTFFYITQPLYFLLHLFYCLPNDNRQSICRCI